MRMSLKRTLLVLSVAAGIAIPSGPLLAQSNWQQQQQMQRQMEMQRQQQMQQEQQRRQMQEQQRRQMQEQQRQQMQAQQRQQMQIQQRQQMQDQQRRQMQEQQRQQTQVQQQAQQRQRMQQQTADQQRQQMQRQGVLGKDNKATGVTISGGVAKMARPLTPAEIQRGFTGRVTADGRALIKYQGRVFAVPASRVSGLSARLATQQQVQQRASRWTAQQQTAVVDKIAALATLEHGSGRTTARSISSPAPISGGGSGGSNSGCQPPSSPRCQFKTNAENQEQAIVIRSPLIQERIDSSKAYKAAEKTLAHKWLNEDGKIKWPPNAGFVEPPQKIVLKPGARIDRYGDRDGSYFSPAGTLFEHRGLPESFRQAPRMTYEILKELPATSGIAAPWFDQPGGGTQHKLDMSVFELERQGYIKRIDKQ